MLQFLEENYQGPAFELWGITHLGAIGVIIVLNLLLISSKNASDGTKTSIRWLLALILIANEIAWHYWNVAYDNWTIQTMLPLHLCSLLVWLGALMLVTRSYRIYEFMYFMGIGGAIQALATPGIGIYGFPHFIFFQYFISHGLIITSAIYMTTVIGLRPTWKSILRVVIWMNIYVVIIYFVNVAIGSNYLMLLEKPSTPSLLDRLPEWPLYILYMEGIGLVTCILLYLPFAIKDWRHKYLMNKDNASRLESISK
ncbi:MAG TPA: TIGR02206 family membrane protein [Anaerolineales bacterium]|nr:TIGR02206 family membrane protein [Anaerolineales bacterium]